MRKYKSKNLRLFYIFDKYGIHGVSMSFSLPSFDCVATSLASSLPQEGLSKLSFPTKNTNLDHERYYLWNSLDAS